jgi:hypothetical protein
VLTSRLTGTRRRWLGTEAYRPGQIRHVRYLLRQYRRGPASSMHGCACDPGPPAPHTGSRAWPWPRARAACRGGQQVRTRTPRCPASTRIRAAVGHWRGCRWKTPPAPREGSRRRQLGAGQCRTGHVSWSPLH